MVLRESPTTQRSGFFLDFMETDAHPNYLTESGKGSQKRRTESKCYPKCSKKDLKLIFLNF